MLNFFFELFLGVRVHWTKKRVKQKISFEFSSENHLFEKTLFFFHMRWGSRARSKAFLTNAACRDVLTWLKQSSLCAISCRWSRPRDIRCIKPSLSFSLFFLTKNKLHVSSKNFFDTFYYFPIVNLFLLISLLQLFFKIKFPLKKVTCFLFSFPCFYFHFFFSLLFFS